jgi:phenylalanyl-tRNA synthetase beta chain
VRLFEIGTVYLRDANVQDGPLSVAGYDQPKRLAAIAYGPVTEEQWGQPTRNVDYFDVKADMEALFAPQTLRFVKTGHPALHPGRSAQVLIGDKAIGFLGELHPRWQQKYDLPLAPVVFEVDVQAMQMRDIPAYQEISKFPAVTRDIAVVVKQSISVQELMDTFAAEQWSNPACAIMQAIVLFDEYRGKGLENDEKSLAFRFTLQDTQTTLQDDKVDTAMAAFIVSVEKKHGAKLRK